MTAHPGICIATNDDHDDCAMANAWLGLDALSIFGPTTADLFHMVNHYARMARDATRFDPVGYA